MDYSRPEPESDDLEQLMKYTLSPSEDRTYITLAFIGDINRHTTMQHIKQAHALAKELGTNKFLLDLREATNTDSTTDQYEFVHRDLLQSEDLDVFACVAALVDPENHSHDFLETVFRNIGFNLKLFNDRDEALNFIKN
jgi:hypothetical protein